MNKKVFGILICTLLVTTVLPVTGTISVNQKKSVTENSIASMNDIDWWSKFHHDLNNSGYSTSSGPNTNNVLWTYQTTNNPHGFVQSSPAVAEGKVYIGSCVAWPECGKLFCLDATTGAKIWEYQQTGTYFIIASSPAVVDGKVYVGCDGFSFLPNPPYVENFGKVYCLDANTGAWIWEYKISTGDTQAGVGSSPAVADGRVYVGSLGEDKKVYCLNASTGVKIWEYTTGDLIYSSPAVADGKVYIGSGDHNVYCLDAMGNGDGTTDLIWSYTAGYWVDSSPAVADGKVYIGSDDGKLYCLNADNGSEIWNYTAGPIASDPAVAYGEIYVGSFDHNVYCLNAENGTKIWEYKTGDAIASSAAIADGKVYIGSEDKKVYCLDATGNGNGTTNLIWSYTTGDVIYSSPAVAEGKVYIGSNDRKVYCFGSSDENQPPNAPTITGPARGKPGTSYDFTFNAVDPDGDQVKYFVDWGDGKTDTTALNPSGTDVKVSHAWSTKGTYSIRAYAQDSYGLIGPESTKSVTMPRDKTVNRPILQFLQQHQNMFPIIQKIIQRVGL